MNKTKRFFYEFLASEGFGFLLGGPLCGTYAALLADIRGENVYKTFIYILIVTIIVVLFIAIPSNLFITKNIIKLLNEFYNGYLTLDQKKFLLKKIRNLPILQGILLFSRIAFGATVVALLLFLNLDIPPIQIIIAFLVGLYGGYITSLITFSSLQLITRSISEDIIESEKNCLLSFVEYKLNHLNYFHYALLYLILPIIFTTLTIILAFYSSSISKLPYEILSKKILYISLVNLFTLIISSFAVVIIISKKVALMKKYLKDIALINYNENSYIHTDLSDDFAHITLLINIALINLSKLIKKLSSTNNTIKEEIKNLINVSNKIQEIANIESSAIKEIITTMEDSNQMAKEIENKLNNVQTLTTDNFKYVNTGSIKLEDTYNKIMEVKESSEENIKGIKLLNDRISNIWEIVNIINSIADQTKIIAFNAELEASSAGDYGKNFEIVATEIRRLADNTVTSTKEIKNKINEIQKSSHNLIYITENSNSKIEEGIKSINDLKEVFENIKNSSEKSVESSKVIYEAMKLQAKSSEQILLTLKDISKNIESLLETSSINNKSIKNLLEISSKEEY